MQYNKINKNKHIRRRQNRRKRASENGQKTDIDTETHSLLYSGIPKKTQNWKPLCVCVCVHTHTQRTTGVKKEKKINKIIKRGKSPVWHYDTNPKDIIKFIYFGHLLLACSLT